MTDQALSRPPIKRFTRDERAARVARDIWEGAYVNLGIGLPTQVANRACIRGAAALDRGAAAADGNGALTTLLDLR